MINVTVTVGISSLVSTEEFIALADGLMLVEATSPDVNDMTLGSGPMQLDVDMLLAAEDELDAVTRALGIVVSALRSTLPKRSFTRPTVTVTDAEVLV